MRIIAGKAKGLTLAAPKGLGTRPTADRMKEDLFNILTSYVPGASFLDLYAGSGAIGIEALSRGAKEAVFVEQSKTAATVLRANLGKAALTNQAEVLVQDVHSAITYLENRRDFSLIFLDPPYDNNELPGMLTKLAASAIVRPGAVIIAECPAKAHLPEFVQLVLFREKIYTRTKFVFWKFG